MSRWTAHDEYERTLRQRAYEFRPEEWRFWTSEDYGPTAELCSFLDYFGTAEEIQIRTEAALTLLSTLHRTNLEGEAEQAARDALCTLGRHLDTLQDTARTVEQVLRERGWRYERDLDAWRHEKRVPPGRPSRDVPHGKLKEIGSANRPGELFNREVADLCARWRIDSNTPENRDRIAAALDRVFPPRQLDTRSRGAIHGAVDSYLDKVREARRAERRRKTTPRAAKGA